MELFELKANIREKTGKGVARKLRNTDAIPAILYGLGAEPVKLTVPVKSIENAFKQSVIPQVLVNLTVSDDANTVKTCPAMIKDVQLSPLSKEVLHADFLEIDLGKPVRVNVPVVTTGKCKGVEFGGLLQVIRRELEILCMPLQIPDNITIDVADLEIGDSIHVKEIEREGVEIPADVNFTVITVVAPKGMKGKDEDEDAEEGTEAGTE